jgi:hypothetical protein
MKTLLVLLLASFISGNALAAASARDQIPADAKWFIHVDLESFLGTHLGGVIGRQFVDPKAAKLAEGLRQQFDIDFDWHKIRSLTVYGADFKDPSKAKGVVLIRSDLDIPAVLEIVIDRLQANGGGGGGVPLKRIEGEGVTLYAFQDTVFGAAMSNGLFAIARSSEEVEKAHRVISGRAPHLPAAGEGGTPAEASAGFLTVSVVDAAAANAGLPVKARFLGGAKGGQLVAGEKADKVFLNAALEMKDNAMATQLQQALQGVIAIALLSEDANKDLKQLAQGVKVGGTDSRVVLDLELPVDDVINKVSAEKRKTKREKRKAGAEK